MSEERYGIGKRGIWRILESEAGHEERSDLTGRIGQIPYQQFSAGSARNTNLGGLLVGSDIIIPQLHIRPVAYFQVAEAGNGVGHAQKQRYCA